MKAKVLSEFIENRHAYFSVEIGPKFFQISAIDRVVNEYIIGERRHPDELVLWLEDDECFDTKRQTDTLKVLKQLNYDAELVCQYKGEKHRVIGVHETCRDSIILKVEE